MRFERICLDYIGISSFAGILILQFVDLHLLPCSISSYLPVAAAQTHYNMEPSGKRTSFLGQSEEKPGEGPDTLASLQKTNKLLKKKVVSEREERQALQNLLKAAEEQVTNLQAVLTEKVYERQEQLIEKEGNSRKLLETQMQRLEEEKSALQLQVSSLNHVQSQVNDLQKALEAGKIERIAEENRRKEAETALNSLQTELSQAKL